MNRKKAYLFLSMFLVVFVNEAFTQSSKSRGGAKSDGGTPEVIFFDDFSGNSVDKSKWNVLHHPSFFVNDELQAYVDSSLTVHIAKGAEAAGAKNGALVLHARYSPGFVTKQGRKFDFLSGRMDTKGKVEFSYGTASARIKLPEGSGFWPAFWMLGTGNWPETGEIDIMENIGEKEWSGVALHGKGYSGETPLVNRYYFEPGTDATDWHVYSVEWTPDTIVFKIDDNLVYKVTKTMTSYFGPWAFDNPKYLIVNLAVGGVYPLKNNGVKSPHLGLVDSTFQALKEGKGKVYVDWVKVEKLSSIKK